MIRINKAILHVFDVDSCVSVFSKAELDLEEKPVKAYVRSMCRKALFSTDARHGTFEPNSELSAQLSRYFHGQDELIDLSGSIARFIFGVLERAEKQQSVDLLMADFLDEDDVRYVGAFLLEGKRAFVHDVSQAGEHVSCDIVRRYGVLPSATQKLSSWVLVRSDTMGIAYADKTRVVDGQEALLIPEMLLRCKSEASSKEAIESVTELVEKVASDHGSNTTLALSRAKAYVAERVEEEGAFSRAGLIEEVFPDNEQAQKSLEIQTEAHHIPKRVRIDKRMVAQKRVRNHRIVTDTGIEVSFPAEYGEDSSMIEFKTESNGLISISIKNVGTIENK